MSRPSGLHLVNGSRQLGADWWEWSVWVAGPDLAMQRIKEVVYRLHPTFINPIRVVTDRDSGFKLSSEAWGEFSIAAHVRNDNGTVVRLRRWIQLGDSKVEEAAERPSVFLSYGVTERRFVDPVVAALKRQGVEILTPQELAGDQPLGDSPSDDVTRVNLVAIVISGEPRTLSLLCADRAQALGKHIVTIVLGSVDQSLWPSGPLGKDLLYAKDDGDAVAIADTLAAKTKDIFYSEDVLEESSEPAPSESAS